MPRTWDRSQFAPWLLRELVQVNEKPPLASAAERDRTEPPLAATSCLLLSTIISQPSTFLVQRPAVGSSDWIDLRDSITNASPSIRASASIPDRPRHSQKTRQELRRQYPTRQAQWMRGNDNSGATNESCGRTALIVLSPTRCLRARESKRRFSPTQQMSKGE